VADSDDAHRISRRSLLRLQLARWVDSAPRAPEPPHPGIPGAVVEALVELAGVEAGGQVLDVGVGASTVVRRDADVTASKAGAHDLPYADGAFDVVLCALATTPARSAVRELVRVTCPGGFVALALSDGEESARSRLGGLLDELEMQTVVELEARYLLIRGRRPIPLA
jgi:ubiquinone/menaquinone biosynthesis C-methylase UbiE